MTHYEERVPESSIEILGHLVGGVADRHDDLERATLTGKVLLPSSGVEGALGTTPGRTICVGKRSRSERLDPGLASQARITVVIFFFTD
jgi:hypothetical protein